MWVRSELKERGKRTFKNFYWKSVIVCIIFAILTGGSINSARSNNNTNDYTNNSQYEYYNSENNLDDEISEIPNFISVGVISFIAGIALIGLAIGIIIRLLIVYPIEIGKNNFFMSIQQNEGSLDSLIFIYRSGKLKQSIITMFMKELFQFLWCLLLVIPGIVKMYEYKMIPYILSENPEISRNRAFEISKEMMRGNKWKTFVLDLSFIGWWILSAVTFGILAIFYVCPYVESTNAELYSYLRQEALKNGYAKSSELIGF